MGKSDTNAPRMSSEGLAKKTKDGPVARPVVIETPFFALDFGNSYAVFARKGHEIYVDGESKNYKAILMRLTQLSQEYLA